MGIFGCCTDNYLPNEECVFIVYKNVPKNEIRDKERNV